MRASIFAAAALVGLALYASAAFAEPYLAVQTGFKCGMCHVNPAGGGLRNAFGTAWAQNELASTVVTLGRDDAPGWLGEINRYLAVGGNVRADFEYEDVPGADSMSEFGIRRADLYVAFRAVPDLVTLYVDERIAPGGAIAREAFALVTPANGRYTLKAGKFVLPFGLRLEDDTAFVRQVTGINFDTADHGVELGIELPRWSAQLAVTNGTAGGGENDPGKQTSLHGVYVARRFRVGASYNYNNADLGDREMLGGYVGFRTGPISWLAEADLVTDTVAGGERDARVSLLEGNLRVRRGHHLKVTYEHYDPDDDVDEDERERYSIVWEHSPIQHVQTRIGLRFYNGVPDDAASNRDLLFAELHLYF